MNIQYTKKTESLIAGITIRTPTAFEDGNLALHMTANEDHIVQNREKLMNTIGTSLTQLTIAAQTHSNHIHKVTKADQGRGATTMSDAIPDTDALYTTETGVLLGTLTADCVPVIFYHPENRLIGVIHSGWQGTVKEITPKVLHHLTTKEQIHPRELFVHLGPSLSEEKFEVDTDVYHRYANLGYADDFIRYNETTSKYHIDNQKTVQQQCERNGIPRDQITTDRTCTFLSEAHFSHRQNPQTGRHLSFIMMKE